MVLCCLSSNLWFEKIITLSLWLKGQFLEWVFEMWSSDLFLPKFSSKSRSIFPNEDTYLQMVAGPPLKAFKL